MEGGVVMDGNVILLIMIVLLAAVLQTSTGYGFSVIGTPFLLLLYPAHTAIQANIILSICISAVMIYKIRKEVDKTLLFRLVKSSFAGLLLGIPVYMYLDIRWLKLFVGVLIVVLTVLLIFRLTIERSQKGDFVTGGISGVLTMSIGVPGPPLLLYLSGAKMEKTALRSTTLSYYLFIYLASLIAQIVIGGTDKAAWVLSAYAIVPLFIGVLLGQWLFKWISEKTFRFITFAILLCTGSYLIVSVF